MIAAAIVGQGSLTPGETVPYLQQDQYVVHKVQTLLGVATQEDGETVFRVVGAGNQKTCHILKTCTELRIFHLVNNDLY